MAALVTVVRGGGSNAKPDPERPDRAAVPVAPFSRDAYAGLGAWIDVYDYVPLYQKGGVAPTITPSDVATMASLGVRTLFLQAARHDDRLDGVVSPDLLVPFLREAHQHGMRVVGWYYPTFATRVPISPACADRRLRRRGPALRRAGGRHRGQPGREGPRAAQRQPRRSLEAAARRAAAGAALGATVMPAVQTEVINPQYWPGFPWAQLRPYYDVWLPMAYWSVRVSSSPYHSGYTYVAETCGGCGRSWATRISSFIRSGASPMPSARLTPGTSCEPNHTDAIGGVRSTTTARPAAACGRAAGDRRGAGGAAVAHDDAARSDDDGSGLTGAEQAPQQRVSPQGGDGPPKHRIVRAEFFMFPGGNARG